MMSKPYFNVVILQQPEVLDLLDFDKILEIIDRVLSSKQKHFQIFQNCVITCIKKLQASQNDSDQVERLRQCLGRIFAVMKVHGKALPFSNITLSMSGIVMPQALYTDPDIESLIMEYMPEMIKMIPGSACQDIIPRFIAHRCNNFIYLSHEMQKNTEYQLMAIAHGFWSTMYDGQFNSIEPARLKKAVSQAIANGMFNFLTVASVVRYDYDLHKLAMQTYRNTCVILSGYQ